MSGIRKLAVSAGVGALLLGGTAMADDKKFTAADVLAWDRIQQDWYFTVNTSMVAAIASQNDSPAASCIDRWYFGAANRDARNNEIRSAMDRFKTYHPTLVMIAITEKACGELKS